MEITSRAGSMGRRARHSEVLDRTVRVGLVAYGAVHLLVAWLAVRLAFGDNGNASQQGALHTLAQNTLGRVSLYVVAVGLLALVVWQLLELVAGFRDYDQPRRLGKQLAALGKAVVFAALGVSAFKVAIGAGSSSGNTAGPTARLMSMPAGPLLVAAVGVVLLVIAGGLAYQGLSEGFADKLDLSGRTGHDGRAYLLFGKIGYCAKAVAVAIVGGLFLWAAITHDPHKSGGLDQALHRLLQAPLGSPLLIAVAVGIGCFGVFCFAWARHLNR